MQPNVILVITDDQGYGDLGCTGNPWISTPNIDRFHADSVRLNDFHVSPLCTPTRGAIMTGHNPLRNGAWATTWGRSLLKRDETTLAETFRWSGYRTGMFGKWHLGDNYPFRPQDRGFETVVAHKGGGVGQTPDFWGNSYFDDTYFHNGEAVGHDGYCTDIWFAEAIRFITGAAGEPFFCYLSTNAPHHPYRVAESYARPYRGNPSIPEPEFYGMITNIDENFGRLRRVLAETGLEDDTILVFMTDNGTSGGWDPGTGRGYNAGMRGKKGSYYEGGHRVPFFIRWPSGGMASGRDIDVMLTHTDLFPTFVDLCGLTAPDIEFDGASFAPVLNEPAGHGSGDHGGRNPDAGMPRPRASSSGSFDDRCVFVQYRQHTDPPRQWESALLYRSWRLVNGDELYDIVKDPGQTDDRALAEPELLKALREAQETWWREVSPGLGDYCAITIGSVHENPCRIDAFDLMGDVAWDQTQVRRALRACGRWNLDVAMDGIYEFRLRRWPEEAGSLLCGVPDDGAETVALHPKSASLSIQGRDSIAELPPDAAEAVFRLPLAAGPAVLEALFNDDAGNSWSAYYVYIERTERTV